VWLSNTRNNFAPFAGYMLMELRKQVPLRRGRGEIDETVEDGSAGAETTGNKIDNVPL